MHRLSSLVFALFAVTEVHSFNIFPHHKAAIHARQVSGLPGSEDWGVCESQCKPWQTYMTSCSSGADVLACYCSTTYMDNMVNCYDCLVPLAQQTASSDSRVEDFPAQAQQAIDEVAQSCTEAGHPVTAPKLTAGSGSSSPAAGTSPSVTASQPKSSAPAETGSAAASGASPTGSGAPASENNPNSAASLAASSYAVVAGAVGAAMICLVA